MTKGKADNGDVDRGGVAMGAGGISVRVLSSHELAYTVKWKSAVVRAKKDSVGLGVEGNGDLKGVSGSLYQLGAPAADFSADEGTADNEKGVLTLRGNVKVTAVDRKSVLDGTTVTCERMTYATADEIIKASGNVTVRNTNYSIGPFGEAWCSKTLSQVAAPGEFVQVRHNQPRPPHS